MHEYMKCFGIITRSCNAWTCYYSKTFHKFMHKLVIILILPAVDGEIVDWTEKKEAH
jgi:hypothetical protein